ncbi:MAG TPA: hypothetical protein VJB87_02545 [Candidatus Nanoarchaeia archaeon]|nr:hypothetical protein [Candidatus Nanoarchaeia archaeon]
MVVALVIGVGNTGRIVIENLVKSEEVTDIYLYNRRKFKVEHIQEEIKSLSADKEIIPLPEKDNMPVVPLNFKKSVNVVFICASDYRADQRSEDIHKKTIENKETINFRMAELNQNRKLMMECGVLLKNLKNACIFVISNPVDIFTNVLAKCLDKSNSLFGFGLDLDILRIKHLLRLKGFKEGDLEKVMCIGIHGDPVPLLSHIMSNPEKSLYNELAMGLKDHFVKASLGGVTYLQWNKTLSDLVAGYLGKKDFKTGLVIKMDSFEGLKDYYLGMPVEFKSGKIIGPLNFSLNKIEKEMFLEKSKILVSST